MKNKALSLAVVTAVAALAAQQGLAYEAGDIILRAGVATVAPDESSDGIAVPALGIAPLAGTEARVDNNSQLGLTASYMLTSNFGLELLAASPFSHDISADLGGLGRYDAGNTRHLPPTLSLVWYPFGDTASRLQPYVSAGVNYTIFFDESVDSEVEVLAGILAGTGPIPMELELEDSVGLAAQLGLDVALTDNWQLNAAVRWIDIDTEATFKTRNGSVLPKGTRVITVDDVEIDPLVYQLTLGYRF